MSKVAKVGIDDYLTANGRIDDIPTMSVTPRMAPEAYHGLAGHIVRAIEPHSEADPVAILAHVLIGVGNMIGRSPHALVERTEHTCGEYVVLVGASAKGRKDRRGRRRAIYSSRSTTNGQRHALRAG